MQLSRRNFLRSSALSGAAAAAAVATSPESLLAFKEPSRAAKPGGPILLNSNENPYGPWQSLLDPMRDAVPLCNRYPDHHYDALVNGIAALHGVKADQVITGCGSSEILRLCAEVFCKPGSTLLVAAPTFESLGYYVTARGGKVRSVPLNSKFEHDLARMVPGDGERVGLVYICNPNNPTASLTPRKDIEAYLKTLGPDTYVLIDEAYHHFALSSPDYASFIDHPVDNPRVVVARTFSKIYGLAGMRLGYAVAAADVAKRMRPYMTFDNVNMVAAQCGATALADTSGLAAAIQRIGADRVEFLAQCAKRTVNTIPAFANFVMVETGKPVRSVMKHFKDNNVMIGRPFAGMDTYARISLGKPDEMATFWQVWDRMA